MFTENSLDKDMEQITRAQLVYLKGNEASQNNSKKRIEEKITENPNTLDWCTLACLKIYLKLKEMELRFE